MSETSFPRVPTQAEIDADAEGQEQLELGVVAVANWPAEGLKPHPIAGIFRMMDDAELDDLAERIRANGLRQPIVIYEGMILDGRNRYLACLKAGEFEASIDWRYDDKHFVGFGGLGWDPAQMDPVTYVWDTNEGRRHDS